MVINPKIVVTDDGSNTLVHPTIGAHYHSTFGAKQESDFIFIQEGIDFYVKKLDVKSVSILEMGFGSGLNAYNTLLYGLEHNISINYCGIEKYPIDVKLISELDYPKILNSENTANLFQNMHTSKWEEYSEISKEFQLKKINKSLGNIDLEEKFDIIYFDAFGPKDQPELWSVSVFEKMFSLLNTNGILVTYCSKGIVKNALRAVGFDLQRLAGPPSKRHILRATKL
ncbi:tRNA (5-methylaminomethyl-2-thiouridine)(34)-methyltransferase MnmD [Aurantibacter sp.]|uniref:tRNA (5-methylaminomethyl-2-thiouridine)(34)-methyltransferase MnmD n=1 Tax=Aurantibacter sp. TaxID=2807103 RepID=UPI0035C7FA1D